MLKDIIGYKTLVSIETKEQRDQINEALKTYKMAPIPPVDEEDLDEGESAYPMIALPTAFAASGYLVGTASAIEAYMKVGYSIISPQALLYRLADMSRQEDNPPWREHSPLGDDFLDEEEEDMDPEEIEALRNAFDLHDTFYGYNYPEDRKNDRCINIHVGSNVRTLNIELG